MNKLCLNAARLLPLFALIVPTGCLSLRSSEPPPSIYALQPEKTDAPASPDIATAPIILTIPKPGLPAGFQTDQIALYFAQGHRVEYFAGARWPAPLDDVLREFIADTARRQLPGTVVDMADLRVPAQYRLAVKVTEFQPVYDGAPQGTPHLYIAMAVTLISALDDRIVTHFVIADNRVAANDSLPAITGGLESLLRGLLDQAMTNIRPLLVLPAPPTDMSTAANG